MSDPDKRIYIPENRNVDFKDRFINENGHMEWTGRDITGKFTRYYYNGIVTVTGTDTIATQGISYKHRVSDKDFEYWTTFTDCEQIVIWYRKKANGHIYAPVIPACLENDELPDVRPLQEWYRPYRPNIIDELEYRHALEEVKWFDVDFANRITIATGKERWVRRNDIDLPELWEGDPDFDDGHMMATVVRHPGAFYDTGEQWCSDCHVKMNRISNAWVCPHCGETFSLYEIDQNDFGEYCPTEESSYQDTVRPEEIWMADYGFFDLHE